jgi:CRP/FNR family transcriptional regulator
LTDPISAKDLKRCPLFAGLSDSEAQALAGISRVQTAAARQHLFFEGDEAHGFYVLLSGEMKVFRSSAEGQELTLHRIRPGQMFAEAAVFGQGTYPASCVAGETSSVLYIPRDPFFALIKSSPDIALKIMGALSGWLREFADKLESLSLKSVTSRLADYLLRSGPGRRHDRLELTVSKTEIARELGTVPETLSRSFRSLQDQGVIAVSGRQIQILDREALQQVATGQKS